MFFFEGELPKTIKTRGKIRAQHILILVDFEERVSKWLWTLK
jgi:hypothetical protein